MTGSGKSATGNTILEREVFRAEHSLLPVTQKCQREVGDVEGRIVTVIDTPGLCCRSDKNDHLSAQLKNFLAIADSGPHVFLVLVSLTQRVTEEEKNTLSVVMDNLGKDVWRYSIILFTHEDKLKGKPLESWIGASKYLGLLINKCGRRYHSIANDGRHGRAQVKELLVKIDKLVSMNRNFYTTEMHIAAQKQMREKEEKRKEEEQKKLKKEQEKNLNHLVWTFIDEMKKCILDRGNLEFRSLAPLAAVGGSLLLLAGPMLPALLGIGFALFTKLKRLRQEAMQ